MGFTVTIDDREKQSRIEKATEYFEEQGDTVRIKHLDIGDYIINKHCVFEYKRLDDFVKSVKKETHVEEVTRIMDWFGKQLHEIGLKHDFTKLGANFEEYSEVVLAGLPEGEFEKTDWCQRHYFEERHHVS